MNLEDLPLSENAPIFERDGISFQFVKTADESPSIRLWSSLQPPEIMHHSGGALAESVYIYGGLLSETLERGFMPISVGSVGLGCAYNEWISLAIFMRVGVTEANIESFESNPILRMTFLSWVLEEWPDDEIPDDPLTQKLIEVFSDVVNRVALNFGVSATQLLIMGRRMIVDGSWAVREELNSDCEYTQPYTAIFFDAFSTKSTPELWSEEFLVDFLTRSAASTCGLSTYAATGRLNRALRACGFELGEFSGFAGKRQSTRAFRG